MTSPILPHSVNNAQDVFAHYMEMALEAANANVDSDVRYELRYSLRSAFEDVFSYIDKLEARVATLEAQITRTAPIMKPAALTAPQPAAAPAIEAIEDIVVRGLNQWKTLRYGNLTKGQQIAADNLIARGEAVRIGDYIKSAPPPAVPPQPPAPIAWDAPAPADGGAWLDKPFTKAAPERRTVVITKDDLIGAMDSIDATIDRELAAQGLRRARRADGEPGWYVMTSAGNVWATDAEAH